jgi:hypothetical protein
MSAVMITGAVTVMSVVMVIVVTVATTMTITRVVSAVIVLPRPMLTLLVKYAINMGTQLVIVGGVMLMTRMTVRRLLTLPLMVLIQTGIPILVLQIILPVN